MQLRLIEVLVPFAQSDNLSVAKGAIRSLANFRSAAAVPALLSVLGGAKEAGVAIACCQALAQTRDPSCVDALADVLVLKKRALFGRRWDEQVRATAALALGQIPHPRAAEILSSYVEDPDPRVRQLAQSALKRAQQETQVPRKEPS